MQCTNSCSVPIGVVRCRGNIGSYSTLGRHERFEDHRSHQQRPGGSHLPSVRLRRRRRPLQSCARTHGKALSTPPPTTKLNLSVQFSQFNERLVLFAIVYYRSKTRLLTYHIWKLYSALQLMHGQSYHFCLNTLSLWYIQLYNIYICNEFVLIHPFCWFHSGLFNF